MQRNHITARRALLRTTTALTGAVLALGLTACSGASTGSAGSQSPTSAAAGEASAAAQTGLSLERAWVKTAKKGEMTAVFGTLTNHTDAPIVVRSAKTPVAGMVQLHETVVDGGGSSKMQEKKAGFTVPAHGDYELKPGGDHIMLMKLTGDIQPGEQITVAATTDSGSVTFAATAKDYTGAKENYDMDESSGHDH